MGTTTAGLPLTGKYSRAHYERCPGCATVFRSSRRTRYRCPQCHRVMYALAVEDGATGYHRRALEGDARTFRVFLRRPGEGEALPDAGSDVAMWLESADPAPAPDAPPSAPPHPGPAEPPTPTSRTAAHDRERGAGRLSRLWRGSLGEVARRG